MALAGDGKLPQSLPFRVPAHGPCQAACPAEMRALTKQDRPVLPRLDDLLANEGSFRGATGVA